MKTVAKILLFTAIALFWIIPIALVPFVTVLPYLFTISMGERFVLSTIFTCVLGSCWLLASTNQERRAAFATAGRRKKRPVSQAAFSCSLIFLHSWGVICSERLLRN
jgi:hypothetical protein